MQALPVTAILETLKNRLAHCPGAVLQAPPGAGKTTLTPLALLDEPWLAHKRIMLLEPRRLAARAAARRMAALRGEPVGSTVGYRMRMDQRIGPSTRIEVVTEGVLTRMLQSDPGLKGVGLVIFDEFHEHSLQADLGLTLCLDIQGALNTDLRLLVMSATLETEPVAVLMGNVPVITCRGRTFPVTTRYGGPRQRQGLEKRVTDKVRSVAAEVDASILVFLPGAREIGQVARRLAAARLGAQWIIAPLYGRLTRADQDRAIRPAPRGKRKIVLASAIAETSLTIDGIRVVVDSGFMRVPRYDRRSGMTRLVTLPVSKASADQRRGRAGRTAHGWRIEGNRGAIVSRHGPVECPARPVPADAVGAPDRQDARRIQRRDFQGGLCRGAYHHSEGNTVVTQRIEHLLRCRDLLLAPLVMRVDVRQRGWGGHGHPGQCREQQSGQGENPAGRTGGYTGHSVAL